MQLQDSDRIKWPNFWKVIQALKKLQFILKGEFSVFYLFLLHTFFNVF